MVEEIGEKIKQIRHKLELSQRQLAKKIGATHISVYKWEKGTTKPHHVFVEKIEQLNEEDNSSHTSV